MSTEPLKNTVLTGWYVRLLFWKTPAQNFCTLLTTPTTRQSSRVLASSPVRQSCLMSLGVEPWPTAWSSSTPS